MIKSLSFIIDCGVNELHVSENQEEEVRGDDDDLEEGAPVTAVLQLVFTTFGSEKKPFLEQAGSFWTSFGSLVDQRIRDSSCSSQWLARPSPPGTHLKKTLFKNTKTSIIQSI